MQNETEGIKPQGENEAVPTAAKDYYEKGISAIKRENFGYAAELFASALALKQDFADARYHLWFALRQEQKRSPDPFKIKTLLRKIAGAFLTLQGVSLQKSGRTWEAIYRLEKAMRTDSGNTTTLNAMANCFLKEGLILNAVRILEAVPQIDAGNVKALKKLGNLYIKTENYEKARRCYETALKLNPSDMEAERGVKDLDALKTLRGSFHAEGKS